MKIIQHPDTYICEICGAEYKRKELAEYCENFNLSTSEISIGDTILVESRYDGYFEEKVTDVLLKSTQVFIRQDDEQDIITHRDGTKYTPLEWVKKFDLQPHKWVIITENDIEICKNGSTSNEWYESEVVDLKKCQWVDDYESMPQECIVKWFENGIITIRNSGKEHYKQHWSYKTTFIAWLKK
jgi:hypothetical protein